jgi:hypothetical protein
MPVLIFRFDLVAIVRIVHNLAASVVLVAKSKLWRSENANMARTANCRIPDNFI